MIYRVCRKSKDGFESEEFGSLEAAKDEKKKNGGFIDYYDELMRCWKQLKELK